MSPTREAVLAERLKQLVVAWVAALPRAGWSGSPADLAGELADLEADRRFYAVVPQARGVGDALTLAAAEIARAGWRWSQRRTGRGRLVEFTRIPGRPPKTPPRP